MSDENGYLDGDGEDVSANHAEAHAPAPHLPAHAAHAAGFVDPDDAGQATGPLPEEAIEINPDMAASPAANPYAAATPAPDREGAPTTAAHMAPKPKAPEPEPEHDAGDVPVPAAPSEAHDADGAEPLADDDLETTGPLPLIPDASSDAKAADDPDSTGPLPIDATGNFDPRVGSIDLDARKDAEIEMGANTRLSWAARTDVGLVRSHNEDSYLARSPLFGVCDGMGGHAAGEVASAIAVKSIAQHAPERADDTLLGAAVEAANEAVIEGAATGVGKPGMGCTASCCIIEDTHMAVAHAGDSRIYLLRAGTLVRVTHDHSYVEELVDAGEITADEARVHPSRSVITRALGSDPDMYADHFTLDVERGDRIIVCSDGLSSMVPDETIESLALSSATPRDCVDTLVSAALAEGGHDNVTVIVVDVVSDGSEEARRKARGRAIVGWAGAVIGVIAAVCVGLALIVSNSWYVGAYAGNVGIYHGVHATVLGVQLSRLEQSTQVGLTDLPESTQHQLAAGISVSSMDDALKTVDAYKTQIARDQAKAEGVAQGAQSESTDGSVGDEDGAAGPDAAGTEAATTEAQTAQAPEGGE